MIKFVADDHWMYYNPHPKHKYTRDCVKRSICAVTGEDYMDVQRELNRIRHRLADEHPEWPESYYESFRCKRVHDQYAIDHGWTLRRFTDEGVYDASVMNAGRFCKEHPKGKYILHQYRHWVACIDGQIWDWSNVADEAVDHYWIVEEE